MVSELHDEGEQGEHLLTKGELSLETSVSRSKPVIWQWLAVGFSCVVSLILGYHLGQLVDAQEQSSKTNYGLPLPPGSILTTWEHNLTFTQRPSRESEAAWASIIPVGRGFVHHPELAPFVSNIAVFHQVHCLHAMLVAYYEALESAPVTHLADVPDFENTTSTRIAPFHIRHCYDYIRQALLCAADTNLEVLDHETHLTNGWGQPKKCRDYTKIFAWAELYANSSDTGIVT